MAIGNGAQVVQTDGERGAPASTGDGDVGSVSDRQQRCADLAENIREMLELIKG